MNEQPRKVMDFEKYKARAKDVDGMSVKPLEIEEGFTPADYDDHSQAPGRHEPWMASVPVILLIEYLRKYPDHGATIHARGDVIWMGFRPGINAAALGDGRGQIAINMFGLFQDAAKDLRAMIAQGINIPLLIHHQPRKAKVQ